MNPTSETGIWAYFSYFLTVFLYISAMQKKYQFSKVRFPHSEIDQNLILRSLGGRGDRNAPSTSAEIQKYSQEIREIRPNTGLGFILKYSG